MSNIVEEYCSLSGQAINVNKSCIRFGRVVHHMHRRILCRSLGMSKTKGPFKYLGVIIDGKCMPIYNFQYLYDRSKSRVSGWKMRTISFGDSVNLLRSVSNTLPMYSLSRARVLNTVIVKFEQLCRVFLWGNENERRGMRLVSLMLLRDQREMEAFASEDSSNSEKLCLESKSGD